jgi:hypothetical protein
MTKTPVKGSTGSTTTSSSSNSNKKKKYEAFRQSCLERARHQRREYLRLERSILRRRKQLKGGGWTSSWKYQDDDDDQHHGGLRLRWHRLASTVAASGDTAAVLRTVQAAILAPGAPIDDDYTSTMEMEWTTDLDRLRQCYRSELEMTDDEWEDLLREVQEEIGREEEEEEEDCDDYEYCDGNGDDEEDDREHRLLEEVLEAERAEQAHWNDLGAEWLANKSAGKVDDDDETWDGGDDFAVVQCPICRDGKLDMLVSGENPLQYMMVCPRYRVGSCSMRLDVPSPSLSSSLSPSSLVRSHHPLEVLRRQLQDAHDEHAASGCPCPEMLDFRVVCSFSDDASYTSSFLPSCVGRPRQGRRALLQATCPACRGTKTVYAAG